MKVTNEEKTAQLGSHKFVAARKLYCLIGPIYSGVSALIKRSKDINKNIGGQKLADIENKRSKSKKSKN